MNRNMMGTYYHNVDSKGRLIVPAKLRDLLGSEFVVTKGQDTNLYLFSYNEWDGFADKLNALPNNKENRMVKRYFMGNASPVEVDSQGRIVIPAKLRQDAQIEKEVVIVGAGNKAEIWSEKLWNIAEEEPDYSQDAVNDRIDALGISI
ncbi:MAG: division/cell wall cluster transcriptional repressor MraZ [Eubacterium sp.]|nr:division/cell wall cluster transcriptional repressor MraZ [Eubacterium sp.]MCR5291910.1 division/cell wall cluster transcriptional repressor MraZ [Eubacterium sp.]